jgi:hypothetical protein
MTTKTYELLVTLMKLHPNVTKDEIGKMYKAEITANPELLKECIRELFNENIKIVAPELRRKFQS